MNTTINPVPATEFKPEFTEFVVQPEQVPAVPAKKENPFMKFLAPITKAAKAVLNPVVKAVKFTIKVVTGTINLALNTVTAVALAVALAAILTVGVALVALGAVAFGIQWVVNLPNTIINK